MSVGALPEQELYEAMPRLSSNNFPKKLTSLKTMTSWIKSDGVYMLFTKGRPSTKTWKEPPRRLIGGQVQEEVIYRGIIQERGFIPEVSKIYLYMKRKIPDYPVPHEVFLCLGWFFARNLNIQFPREAYRRKTTTIYWLNQIFNQIMNYLHTHQVSICYKTFIINLD